MIVVEVIDFVTEPGLQAFSQLSSNSANDIRSAINAVGVQHITRLFRLAVIALAPVSVAVLGTQSKLNFEIGDAVAAPMSLAKSGRFLSLVLDRRFALKKTLLKAESSSQVKAANNDLSSNFFRSSYASAKNLGIILPHWRCISHSKLSSFPVMHNFVAGLFVGTC